METIVVKKMSARPAEALTYSTTFDNMNIRQFFYANKKYEFTNKRILEIEDPKYRPSNINNIFPKDLQEQDAVPKILLVEDDLFTQIIHKKFLQLMGYEVELAKNGKEAINMCAQGYDLILLDIGLPDMDGLTVCNTLRHTTDVIDIPIIALTAYGDIVKNDCLRVGFDAVMSKPIIFEEFKQLLKKWL